MNKIEEISLPIKDFKEEFQKLFKESIKSSSPLVQASIDHIQSTSGKHLRPLFLALCTSLCGGKSNEKSLHSAVILELLHTASLIHDDVIDFSLQRRGKPSLNAIYDNHIAVLVGDYIFSSAFMLATEMGDKKMMQVTATVGKNLTEGELQQIEIAQDSSFTREEKYYDIIHKKTAYLFEAFGYLGANSISSASLEDKINCGKIGKLLGYAFQIKDDIFDYIPNAQIGKPTGNDILEGKKTLPLILAYNNASKEDKKKLEEWILQVPTDKKFVEKILHFVQENKGIEGSEKKMISFIEEAKKIILTFKDSAARESLLKLADFIAQRDF